MNAQCLCSFNFVTGRSDHFVTVWQYISIIGMNAQCLCSFNFVTGRSDLFVTNSPPCFWGNGEWVLHPCAVGAWILSHGSFTSFALCLYQFLKVLLMSLEESKIVWRLCLTGFYNAGIALTAIRSESTFSW